MNCQQYVRQSIESFGLQIPDGIHLAGDTLPVIIDLAILMMQKKQQKRMNQTRKFQKRVVMLRRIFVRLVKLMILRKMTLLDGRNNCSESTK